MPKLKILVAEDSKSMQVFYRKELPEGLFESRIAPDGAAAVEEYNTWQPDIILLDINMPELNGYQVLKAIREDKGDTATTVIMVSSLSEKSEIVACANLGIQGFIVKPFKGGELVPKIMECHRTNKGNA